MLSCSSRPIQTCRGGVPHDQRGRWVVCLFASCYNHDICFLQSYLEYISSTETVPFTSPSRARVESLLCLLRQICLDTFHDSIDVHVNMARIPVGPRAGKDEFMRALGLTPGDSRCEGVYRNMRVSCSMRPLRKPHSDNRVRTKPSQCTTS